jgi:hypothetical protein
MGVSFAELNSPASLMRKGGASKEIIAKAEEMIPATLHLRFSRAWP